ncbi:hypothetical protein Rhopal_002082-T1 [Rhodotorula paludigena]|uniref:Uncharacterized protein n=1 Tax=Rhodotorula paludigena TaxID=86838 RepID=A0AAV5GKC8_9BASI|nr:hypothetical protein Rhopal_002082-T1 [Rhodotorula paludigena]
MNDLKSTARAICHALFPADQTFGRLPARTRSEARCLLEGLAPELAYCDGGWKATELLEHAHGLRHASYNKAAKKTGLRFPGQHHSVPSSSSPAVKLEDVRSPASADSLVLTPTVLATSPARARSESLIGTPEPNDDDESALLDASPVRTTGGNPEATVTALSKTAIELGVSTILRQQAEKAAANRRAREKKGLSLPKGQPARVLNAARKLDELVPHPRSPTKREIKRRTDPDFDERDLPSETPPKRRRGAGSRGGKKEKMERSKP